MRIGIITIDSINYGNRLQNYALQTILEKYGCKVKTFKRDYNFVNHFTKRKILIKQFVAMLTQKSKNPKHVVNSKVCSFIKFNQTYIHWDEKMYAKEITLEYLEENYDLLVCGSDQIWNTAFSFTTEADFINYNIKIPKVAVSASVGMDKIDSETDKILGTWLSDYEYISVREFGAKSLLQPYFNDEIFVCCDPTLMLNASEWEQLISKPIYTHRKYLLKYYLGENNKKLDDFIKSTAMEKDMEVIDLSPAGCRIGGIGPGEFLWYIKHAVYVVTDSYHATIFSILFEKQFSVYNRVEKECEMNNRIQTLLGLFDLENRMELYKIHQMDEHIDFPAIKLKIEEERDKMTSFLKKILIQ